MDRTIITPQGIDINDSGKSLRIFFMYKNTRCRETLNLPPTKANIKYATNLRAEILNKIAKNEFNYNEYFPESRLAKRLGMIKEVKNTKCSDLFEQQLSNYAKMVENGYMSPSTFVGYRKVIAGQLLPVFGAYDIHELTAPIIREWISSMGATPKTIRNCLTPLRNMFADAMNDDLIKTNPIEQIALSKLIQVASKKSEFDAEPFNEVDKQLIIDAANGQIKNLIQFGFWSGLRTSELIALKWTDIDFKRGIANITRAKVCNVEKGTKTKSGVRDLILLPKALEALKNQLPYTKDSEYVFHNPNTNQAWANSNKVSEAWRKLLITLDIKYRNCYQMRHTFASTLLSNGENAWWVATQMGHVDVEMIFKRYGRWIPKAENNGYKFVGDY
jgi:integrase